jgi:hypothetical protein
MYLLNETLFSATKYKFARRTVKRSFAKTAFFWFGRLLGMAAQRPQTAPDEG